MGATLPDTLTAAEVRARLRIRPQIQLPRFLTEAQLLAELGRPSGPLPARVRGHPMPAPVPPDCFLYCAGGWTEPMWDRYAVWPDKRPVYDDLVYFVQMRDGPIKIGATGDPLKRIRALQTACPSPLTLLAIMDGGYQVEAALHRLFRRFRLHGEWFSPAAPLVHFIDDLVAEEEAA